MFEEDQDNSNKSDDIGSLLPAAAGESLFGEVVGAILCLNCNRNRRGGH